MSQMFQHPRLQRELRKEYEAKYGKQGQGRQPQEQPVPEDQPQSKEEELEQTRKRLKGFLEQQYEKNKAKKQREIERANVKNPKKN